MNWFDYIILMMIFSFLAYAYWLYQNYKKDIALAAEEEEKHLAIDQQKYTLFLGNKASEILQKKVHDNGYPVKHGSEPRGWLFLGEQGSGKTNAILSLVEKIQMRSTPCMRIFYDTKPDFYSRYLGENDSYTFGLGVEGTAVFQIFSELKNEKDVDFLVNALVIDESDTTSANSEHFMEQTKLLLKAMFLHIMESHENPSNIEMINFLLEFDDAGKFKDEIESKGIAKSYGISVASVLGGGKSDPQSASAWSNFNKYATKLKRREFYTREGASPSQILEVFENEYRLNNENIDVFLLNPAADQDSFSPWIRMILACLSRAVRTLENGKERRVWFICDEFQTLGKFPELAEELPAQGRSKGACVVLATQNLSKLQAVYGKDLTNAILSGAATKIFFRMGDPFSLGVAEKLFGESTTDEARTTMSGYNSLNVSVQKKNVKNVSAETLSSLPVGRACIKIDDAIMIARFEEIKTQEIHIIKRIEAPKFENKLAIEQHVAQVVSNEVYF